jgi:uncharacterized cupin superfamily protein
MDIMMGIVRTRAPFARRPLIATAVGVVATLMAVTAPFALRAAGQQNSATNIVRVDSNITLSHFTPMTEFLEEGRPVPVEALKELYQSSPTGMHIGVWAGGPGVLRITDYPYDEYCVMQAGTLVVTSSSGSVETFHGGDSFVIPKGFNGTWDMKTRMRKQWAVFGPLPLPNQ